MQNGTGRDFSIAKSKLIAVKVFSPPESKLILFKVFPGGHASISIPVSRTLLESVSLSSAVPPLNNSLNVIEIFIMIEISFIIQEELLLHLMK